MLKKIHQRTFEALGPKSESVLTTFYHELNDKADPAYFAPYLRSNRRTIGLSEPLIELATLEWTVYSVESQVGAWRHVKPSEVLTLNPSLNLLQLQYDVWPVYRGEKSLTEVEAQKNAHVLAVYLQPEQRLSSFCKIMPEWALVIDALMEGSHTQQNLLNLISRKYKVLFPKAQIDSIIAHLYNLRLVE